MHAGGSARLLLVVRLALSILSVMIIVTTPPCNSQCDAGLDVRAPMYWNGQWVIIQVVDCGVVQPEFEADMSGATDHQPDADADIYSIPARWNWYPPPEVTDDMQCYFKTDWNLRIAAGSGPVNSSAMYSAASVSDLPESGEVPDVDVLNQFELWALCQLD
ncbi:hypothetical protein Pelo_17813 [Pelomyxa schiedti]|nr:hypothetical protein Pelo_17813 [Pelomyxa schiedti]